MGRKKKPLQIDEIRKAIAAINNVSDYNFLLLEKQFLDFIAFNTTTLSYDTFKSLLDKDKVLCTKLERSFGVNVFPIKAYKVYSVPDNVSETYQDIDYITSQWYDIRYNKIKERILDLTDSMDKYQHSIEEKK